MAIRHNEDGTIGAHHKLINEMLRDGAVIMATELAPEPVEGAQLEAVLGQATVAALAEADALKVEVGVLKTEAEGYRSQLADKATELEKRRLQITELTARIADLERQAAQTVEQ